MRTLANCMSSLKVVVLAGSFILVPAALAQQEVSPDIYGDHSPSLAQKAKPAEHASKKRTDAKKVTAASRQRNHAAKKASDRKLASDNVKPVTLAQAR